MVCVFIECRNIPNNVIDTVAIGPELSSLSQTLSLVDIVQHNDSPENK